MRDFWESWESISQDPWVGQVLREGYQLPFRELPPLSPVPIPFRTYPSRSPQFKALAVEIEGMVSKGVIEEVPLPLNSGYYARIFVVPKGDQGEEWRPVIDLSSLNTYLLLTPFKMETSRSVLQSIRRDDFMISLDLKEAYFQVPVHPHSSRYLRFVWEGVNYQFRALCFGLATAPQVFTRVCAVVSSALHRQGIRLLRYLDDWLLLAPSLQDCLDHRQILLNTCSMLGLRVNFPKSCLWPSRVVTYLGMVINSETMIVTPKEKRILKFLRLSRAFLASPQPLKQWEVLLGVMASLLDIVPGCRLRMRPLQFALRHAQLRGLSDSTRLPLPPLCRSALEWWLQDNRLRRGGPISPPEPTISMETDASTVGWGCRVGTTLSRGLWSPEESLLHINVLELRAIRMALLHNKTLLLNQTVALYGDNTTALAYIRHGGGTRSPSCFLEAREVLLLAESLGARLVPRFIAGASNVIADSLSRPDQAPAMEWSLHQEICDRLWSLWGTPQVDTFATLFNRKLPLYFSPVPDPLAAGVDAFLQPWQGLFLYMFPPTKLLRRVIQKFRESPGAQAVLIAPGWPQQPWFPDLLSMSIDAPRRLPAWKNLLLSVDLKECLHVGTMNLLAWRLSSTSSESGRFRWRLRRFWPPVTDNPPLRSMRDVGGSSVIGVVGNVSIPSLPLFQDF